MFAHPRTLLLSALLCVSALPAFAQEITEYTGVDTVREIAQDDAGAGDDQGRAWPFCPAPPEIPVRPEVTDTLEEGDIHVLADRANLTDQGISRLRGNVQITRDQQQVTANEVDYDKDDDSADLAGDVKFWDSAIYLEGESAHLDFEDGTGNMNSATYQLVGDRGRGNADQLFMDLGSRTRGTRMSYTTCDPEQEGFDLRSNAWRISASSIDLNHDTDYGSARNVVLRIKDVPVLYLPYLSFPLSDKRKSGFLAPGLGSTNNHGFEILTPYYWNIAPHMDATLTPRWLTDSGVMGMGEFRYLLDRGEGQANVEYLPDDDKFGNQDRSLIGFTHKQAFARNANMFLTYNRVSDDQYLEDFGSQLRVTATRFLERRADFSYRGGWWNVGARVQDFQITDDSVDPASEPYQRLPAISFGMAPWRGKNKLNVAMTGHVAYFNRDNDIFVSEVNGGRLNLHPSISYPMETRSTYLNPKLGVHMTQYDLSDTGPYDTSPSRILPHASIDAGVFLEREFEFAGGDYVQTLDPHVYYLYIPDDDQEDIPVFDTAIANAGFVAMFRDNRFTGLDRIGDANQLALGVTSRIIDRQNGADLGYVRFGQQYFFSDQDVIRLRLRRDGTLVADGRTTSDFLGPVLSEFGVNLARDLQFRGEWQWDPNENITNKLSGRMSYRPEDGRVLNLAYHVRRAAPGVVRRRNVDVDQSDVSFRWPLRPQLSVVGRWNYAVPEAKTLELFGGIEYESCCFGIRAVARRFLNNLDGDFSTGVFLQIELKGLGGIGRNAVDFLNQRIPGYEADF